MSVDRPDYTEAIDKAGEHAAHAAANFARSERASAEALTSIALSLVTLTRQLSDLRPADIHEFLDTIAASDSLNGAPR